MRRIAATDDSQFEAKAGIAPSEADATRPEAPTKADPAAASAKAAGMQRADDPVPYIRDDGPRLDAAQGDPGLEASGGEAPSVGADKSAVQ